MNQLLAHHPKKYIFIMKYNYSDAYPILAHSGKAALQSIAVLLTVAYIAVQLMFGGLPNPPLLHLFSEMMTDLANEIANCLDYKPKMIASPSQPNLPTKTAMTTNMKAKNVTMMS